MSNEHPRFERDGKLLSLRELHDAIRREDEADLARVEAEGLARGMEPFDLAALLAITNHSRSIKVRGEDYLKYKYYCGDPPFKNLSEFGQYIIEVGQWDDW
jgi:hypothetical protein